MPPTTQVLGPPSREPALWAASRDGGRFTTFWPPRLRLSLPLPAGPGRRSFDGGPMRGAFPKRGDGPWMQHRAGGADRWDMPRPSIIVPPPSTHDPHHRELATGMQQTWACALYAAGADIFASHHGLDPDVDPFSAIGGERGVSLTHDEQPPSGRIDAIVLSELQHTNDGWRLPGRILKPACPPTVLPGRAFGGPSGVLDTMVAALRDIGLTLGLEIPTDVGWRNLLSARSIAEGLDRLARTGRAQIKKAEPLPSNLLH